jgi:hypothetical protein
MFNGQDLDGWRGWHREDPPGVWSAENGTLFCKGMTRDEAKPGQKGYIIYDEQFSEFHLKVDWKISEGGNSGYSTWLMKVIIPLLPVRLSCRSWTMNAIRMQSKVRTETMKPELCMT